MRLPLILLLLVVLAGCGNSTPSLQTRIDLGDFESYVIKFEKNSMNHGRRDRIQDLTMTFSELPDGVLGRCIRKTLQTPHIVINPKYWDELDEDEREMLIYHELGHCILLRKHRDDQAKGRPISIMNARFIDRETIKENKDLYIKELFSPEAE